MKAFHETLKSRNDLVGLIACACVGTMSLGAAAAETEFTMTMDVAQADTAQPGATGTGKGCFVYDDVANTLTFEITFSGLSGGIGTETVSHIHGPAALGVGAGVVYNLPVGTPKTGTITLANPPDGGQNYSVAQQVADLQNGLWYVNVHSNHSPGGEIRGQITAGPCNPSVPAASGLGVLAMAILLIAIGVRATHNRRPASA